MLLLFAAPAVKLLTFVIMSRLLVCNHQFVQMCGSTKLFGKSTQQRGEMVIHSETKRTWWQSVARRDGGGGGAVVASGEGGYSTARKEGDKIFKPQLGLRRCRLQPCFELVFIVRGPAERAAPCRRTSPRLRVPLLCLPSCSTRTPTISITTATKKPTNAIPTAGNNLFRRHSDHLQRSSLQYICYVQHLALIQHLRAFPTR